MPSCATLGHGTLGETRALGCQADSWHVSRLVHVVWSNPRKFSCLYFLPPCGYGFNVSEEQNSKLVKVRTSINISKDRCLLHLLTETACQQHWAHCFDHFSNRECKRGLCLQTVSSELGSWVSTCGMGGGRGERSKSRIREEGRCSWGEITGGFGKKEAECPTFLPVADAAPSNDPGSSRPGLDHLDDVEICVGAHGS